VQDLRQALPPRDGAQEAHQDAREAQQEARARAQCTHPDHVPQAGAGCRAEEFRPVPGSGGGAGGGHSRAAGAPAGGERGQAEGGHRAAEDCGGGLRAADEAAAAAGDYEGHHLVRWLLRAEGPGRGHQHGRPEDRPRLGYRIGLTLRVHIYTLATYVSTSTAAVTVRKVFKHASNCSLAGSDCSFINTLNYSSTYYNMNTSYFYIRLYIHAIYVFCFSV